jgi:hypothetical protein
MIINVLKKSKSGQIQCKRKPNEEFMAVGLSHETAEFAVARLRRWLLEIGCVSYQDRIHLLIQADSGGTNACDSCLWKIALQKLADDFQLVITVTHYPTGASKWNLIGHRMFSIISQDWAGQPLVSFETVFKLIRTSKTEPGFCCSAYFDRKQYKTNVGFHQKKKKMPIYILTNCFLNGTILFDLTQIE